MNNIFQVQEYSRIYQGVSYLSALIDCHSVAQSLLLQGGT